VSEVALDSNRFNYSVTSAVGPARPTRQRQQAARFGMALVIAPSSAAHPPICDPPCRNRATLLNLHGAFLERLLMLILLGFLARPERFELPTPRFIVLERLQFAG
jgi:hypothetical protein